MCRHTVHCVYFLFFTYFIPSSFFSWRVTNINCYNIVAKYKENMTKCKTIKKQAAILTIGHAFSTCTSTTIFLMKHCKKMLVSLTSDATVRWSVQSKSHLEKEHLNLSAFFSQPGKKLLAQSTSAKIIWNTDIKSYNTFNRQCSVHHNKIK